MFWLGLALPVCFIAGITGATIPTQLPMLSAVLPWMVLWRRGPMTPWQWLGLSFVAYAAASLFWAINPTDSVYGMWQILLLALAFRLGSVTPDLAPLWRGMAIGLGISSAVAAAQAAGLTSLPSADHPAGLLFNGAVQSALISLVILALVDNRAWFYIPAMLPGLYLAHSRGGWLVLTVGLLSRMRWWVAALVTSLTGAVAFLIHGTTDVLRLQAWSVAYALLTPFGHGAGSFADLFYGNIRPEHVHNDYLQLAFEFGIGAIPVYLILARALYRRGEPYWPVMVGFATLSLFFFPLYCAPLAFVGAVVAGHVLRGDDGLRVAGLFCRSCLMAWLYRTQPGDAVAGGKAVSIQFRDQAAAIGALDAAL